MVSVSQWACAALFVLRHFLPVVVAQDQQALNNPTLSFEQLTSPVESIAVVTRTPIPICPSGVQCAHVSYRENVHYVGVTTVVEVVTEYVTVIRPTTVTRTITSTKTIPGHDCTVYSDTYITRLSTSTVIARTTLYVTKDSTVFEDVVVYKTVFELCTDPPAAASTGASIPGTSIPGTSIPGTSIPGTSIPGTSIPGTSIPGTSIPGTSIPGTSIPGTSIPGTSIVGTSEISQPTPLPDLYQSSILVEMFTFKGALVSLDGRESDPLATERALTVTAQLKSSTTASYPIARTGVPEANPKPGVVKNRMCARKGKSTVHILHGNGWDTHAPKMSNGEITFTDKITFFDDFHKLMQFPNLFENGDHTGLVATEPDDAVQFLQSAGRPTIDGNYDTDGHEDVVLQDLVIDIPDESLPSPKDYDLTITIAAGDDRTYPDSIEIVVPIQRSPADRRFVTISLDSINLPFERLGLIQVTMPGVKRVNFIMREMTYCQDPK